jgi:hypothetical protein
MTATVDWIDRDIHGPINNKPGRISVGVNPPNEIVLCIPMGDGYAAVHVDAHEFDNAMDLAHEKLVEYAADSAKAAAVAARPNPVEVEVEVPLSALGLRGANDGPPPMEAPDPQAKIAKAPPARR